MHLLEAGQWEAVKRKLDAIFVKLEAHWNESHEHILEVYFAVLAHLAMLFTRRSNGSPI